MNTFTKITAAGLVALGLAGAGIAFAKSPTDTPPVSALTFEQIATIAAEAQPGVIQEIELEKKRGKDLIEVEIQAEDGEYEVTIDAASGEVLSVEADKRWFGDDRCDDKKDRNRD